MNNEYLKKLFCLDGKSAIITGGSQGIGKAIAISLAQFGADVTILGRNKELLLQAQREICDLGAKCEYAKFDISDKESVDEFFDEYEKAHEKLDIYVSNAAYSIRKSVLETSGEEMLGIFSTNYMGALFGLQRAAAMMKAKKDGNIVVVTSVNALNPLPSQGVYTTSKCALEGLVRCLAADLCKYNIRVNSIAPGGVNTNMNPDMYANPEVRKKIDPMIPFGHIADPDEMGDVVACMVSDAFRYMTGSTVLVDGGLNLRIQ